MLTIGVNGNVGSVSVQASENIFQIPFASLDILVYSYDVADGGNQGDRTMESQTLSTGSLAVVNGLEFFVREGGVYRAPVTNVVMPDGFRAGRFECTLASWAACKRVYGIC